MAEAGALNRILMSTDAVGGVWTYALDLAGAMARMDVETVLVAMGPAPSAAMQDQARAIAGVRLVVTDLALDWLAEKPEQVKEAGHALADIAAAEGCDSLHLHTPALAVERRAGRPVVSMLHSCLATWWQAVRPQEPLPVDFWWRVRLVAEGMAASDAVVTPTNALAHAAAHAYGLRSLPLVIRNGRAAPKATGEDARQRTPAVITSGRLWDEGKNTVVLDRAAARLVVPVLAAGSTAHPGGTELSFSALHLLGSLSQEELREQLSRVPVYASAAVYEPFGLGVLEAAQAGCALVLSDIPSFRELWSGACQFVAPDDDAGFAEAIRRLLDEPMLLRRLSERARQRARHYTAEAMARETARLHASLIGLSRIRNGAAA